MRGLAASIIARETYQNVMIIVMPMIPLANVAHLINVSQRYSTKLQTSQNIQHCLGQSD